MGVRLRSLGLFTAAERIPIGAAIAIRRLLRRHIDAYDAAVYLVQSGIPVRSEGDYLVIDVEDDEIGSYTARLRRFSSDFKVWQQCLVAKQYAEAARRLQSDGRDRPLVIMDIGANVGFTALYFARQFPDATLLAVEPDEANFALLAEHVRANELANVVPIRAALWGSDRPLDMRRGRGPGHEWAHSVYAADPARGGVSGVTVATLMARHGLRHIDLLKIDIEGAEQDVFGDRSAVAAWLPAVRHLAVELHGPEAAQTVRACLADARYTAIRFGELTLFDRPAIPHPT